MNSEMVKYLLIVAGLARAAASRHLLVAVAAAAAEGNVTRGGNDCSSCR